MSKMNNEREKVENILREFLNAPSLSFNPTDSTETIEAWDSLVTVNLILALSAEFGIVVDIEDHPKFSSLSGIFEVLDI